MSSTVLLRVRRILLATLIGTICGGIASALTLPLIVTLFSGGNGEALNAGWADLPRYAHAGMLCGFLSGIISGMLRALGITTALIAAGVGVASALLLPAYNPIFPWLQ